MSTTHHVAIAGKQWIGDDQKRSHLASNEGRKRPIDVACQWPLAPLPQRNKVALS